MARLEQKEAESDVRVSSVDYSQLRENFNRCKLLHVTILRTIYTQNKPISFSELSTALKKTGVTDKTLRKKVDDLKNLGLIDKLSALIVMLMPVEKHKSNIIEMIKRYYNDMGGIM